METLGTYAGQAALLAPLVVAFAAMLFQAVALGTRYKPAASVAIGILLGVALSYSQDQRPIDGAWIGGVAGLIASGLYAFGKVVEVRDNITAETKTTTILYDPTKSTELPSNLTGLPTKPTELPLKPTELPPIPVELPHG